MTDVIVIEKRHLQKVTKNFIPKYDMYFTTQFNNFITQCDRYHKFDVYRQYANGN